MAFSWKKVGTLAQKATSGGLKLVKGVADVAGDLNIPVISSAAKLVEKGADVAGKAVNSPIVTGMLKATSTAQKSANDTITQAKQAAVSASGTAASQTKAPVSVGTSIPQSTSSMGDSWFGKMWAAVVNWVMALPSWVRWLVVGLTGVGLLYMLFFRKKKRRAPKKRRSSGGSNRTIRKKRTGKKTPSKAAFLKRMAEGRKKAARKRKRG